MSAGLCGEELIPASRRPVSYMFVFLLIYNQSAVLCVFGQPRFRKSYYKTYVNEVLSLKERSFDNSSGRELYTHVSELLLPIEK